MCSYPCDALDFLHCPVWERQLVLINISDHATRIKANHPDASNIPRVLGCLLGQQSGRVVDISNSLEIKYTLVEGSIVIDEAYLIKKQEQCKLRILRRCERICTGDPESEGLLCPLQTSKPFQIWTLSAGMPLVQP